MRVEVFLCIIAYIGLCTCKLEDDYFKTVSLSDGAYCFTLLNGTHQFGCTSTGYSSHGVIVKIADESELADLHTCWRDRFSGYGGKYYLYMNNLLLKRTVVEQIRRSNCLKGLLLYNNESMTISKLDPYSADSSCPNAYSGYYNDECGTNNWNENFAVVREGLINLLWNIQIVYITEPESKSDIEKCIAMFNTPDNGNAVVQYPFCATSMENKQHAAGNSEICIRRSSLDAVMVDLRLEGPTRYCDPLGSYNVYTFIPPPVEKKGQPSKKRHYLLVTARMDSFGLIPAVSPADFSVFTSIITSMAAMRAIGNNWELFEDASKLTDKHILFAFLNGESFDYIGSSHMMFEMQNGSFPGYGSSDDFPFQIAKISPEEVEAIIEPQHIGLSDKLSVLMDKDDSTNPLTAAILNSLQKSTAVATSPGRMPPSAWHHFKKINKNGVGIVLAPYTQSGYSYGRVNSMLDHWEWTPSSKAEVANRIVRASGAILRAAGDYIGVSSDSNITIDEIFVRDLLECFVVVDSYNCDLITKLRDKAVGKAYFKTTYVGVSEGMNIISNMLYPLAMYAIGSTADTKNVKDEKQCTDVAGKQQIYGYNWIGDYRTNKSYCYRHSVTRAIANSPAFLIEGYDMKSNAYSTYTESVYNEFKMKIFLLENDAFELYMILAGIILAFLSFLVIYRCEEKTFIVDEGEQAAEMGEPL